MNSEGTHSVHYMTVHFYLDANLWKRKLQSTEAEKEKSDLEKASKRGYQTILLKTYFLFSSLSNWLKNSISSSYYNKIRNKLFYLS